MKPKHTKTYSNIEFYKSNLNTKNSINSNNKNSNISKKELMKFSKLIKDQNQKEFNQEKSKDSSYIGLDIFSKENVDNDLDSQSKIIEDMEGDVDKRTIEYDDFRKNLRDNIKNNKKIVNTNIIKKGHIYRSQVQKMLGVLRQIDFTHEDQKNEINESTDRIKTEIDKIVHKKSNNFKNRLAYDKLINNSRNLLKDMKGVSSPTILDNEYLRLATEDLETPDHNNIMYVRDQDDNIIQLIKKSIKPISQNNLESNLAKKAKPIFEKGVLKLNSLLGNEDDLNDILNTTPNKFRSKQKQQKILLKLPSIRKQKLDKEVEKVDHIFRNKSVDYSMKEYFKIKKDIISNYKQKKKIENIMQKILGDNLKSVMNFSSNFNGIDDDVKLKIQNEYII